MAAAVAVFVTFHGRAIRVICRYDGIKGAPVSSCASPARPASARRASTPRAALAGRALRIGYQAGGAPLLLSLSIDERGEVTPLYPAGGQPAVPAGVAAPRTFSPTASS